MTAPGISVVIPAYNEEKLLPATIASIQKAMQNYTETLGQQAEIIVVNNSSTDQTAQIAHDMGAVVLNHPIRNIASVRNAGIKLAQYDLVVTMDADSLMPDDTLVQIWQRMQDPSYIGAGLGVEFVTEKLSLKILAFFIQAAVYYTSRIQGGMLCFRKKEALAIGGFPEDRLFAEDLAFGVAMRKHAKQIGKKFSCFKDIRIKSLDRKEVSIKDLWTVVYCEIKMLFGYKPSAEDFKYWYKPER
ncbi:MAG: glycosyltransferase family 2 protein [Bdellovibrionota bacterium]